MTYTPIASITLGSSASSVTFSSIPQDYRDLVLVIDTEGTANSFMSAYPNGDTGNANNVFMRGNGSATGSQVASQITFGTTNSGNRTMAILQWMDYSATDKQKTVLIRDHESGVQVLARAGRWANTGAITSLEVTVGSGSFTTNSTFALYGIEA